MNADKLVCVVDDDASVRDAISLLLGLKGYDCRTFGSGHSFINSAPTRPCCVILDLRLEDMSGLEVQSWIKQQKWPFEIIFLTAYADVDVMRNAFINSAVDFLEKPVVMDQLLEALDKAFSRIKHIEDIQSIGQRLENLTPREKQVFKVIAQGLTHRQIGEMLGISPRTVEVHKGRIMEKLGIKTMAELIKESLRLVDAESGSHPQA